MQAFAMSPGHRVGYRNEWDAVNLTYSIVAGSGDSWEAAFADADQRATK